MTFSSCAFSTKPASHTAETSDNIVTPVAGNAMQTHDQDVEAPGVLLRHNCRQHGDPGTLDRQHISVGPSPDVTKRNDVNTQTDCIVGGTWSSIDASATRSSWHGNSDGPGHGHRQSAPSILAHSTAPLASGERAVEDGLDTDQMPFSSDESDIKSEPDCSDVTKADEERSETHTPLEYQIPEDVLRAAMTAPENTKASFWSNTLYRGPEDVSVLVHYCKTKEVAERVAKHFVNEPVVGFDIEWKPYSSPESIKKNVSLIQLACENRIALFHVALFQGNTAAQLLPPTLKAILESPDIFKVGVAVKGDFSRVNKYLNVEPRGVYELSRLHNLVEHYATEPSKVNNKLVGLAPQVQQHLQLPLYKGGQLIDDPEDLNNVRSSDWSLPLNHQQIHYAAADAYAGFRLFDVLEEKRKQLKPTPPRPLVCDHDPKPKPRSTTSKPRKKRTLTVNDKEVKPAVTEELLATAEQTSEREEEVREEPEEQAQDTEGYETAQEELLDSHQLEGEEPASSEDGSEATGESNDDTASDLEVSSEDEVVVPAAEVSQRRVGRINLSRLRGPDPRYPELPSFRGGDEVDSASDEDLVELPDRVTEMQFGRNNKAAVVSEEGDTTDEFDDSELEEALQDLSIDSDGELQIVRLDTVRIKQEKAPARQLFVAEDDTGNKRVGRSEEADASLAEDDPAMDKEEQRLTDPTNDPEVTAHLQGPPFVGPAPAAPASAPSVPHSEPSTSWPIAPPPIAEHGFTHTPEHALGTAWARSYLSSTIPPPGSLTPSHIRATVPHLRVYHMWHHQHLSLLEIARQVRDPPMASSTVASYILQAITLERMEYDVLAVRELLMGMPEALRRGKWRGLAGRVGAR